MGLDPVVGQGAGVTIDRIGADASAERDVDAEVPQPGGDVAGRAAGTQADLGVGVAGLGDVVEHADADVVDEVADHQDATHSGDQAVAISAARRMLFSAMRRLTSRLSPPVSSTIDSSRNGVTSLPTMPFSSTRRSASSRT